MKQEEYQIVNDIKEQNLEQRFKDMDMDSQKQEIVSRAERFYAPWTLPWVFKDPGNTTSLKQGPDMYVDIGAMLVNSLAASIIDVMFPNDRPFFSLKLNQDYKTKISESENADELTGIVNKELKQLEEASLNRFNLTEYRPKALQALKLLIITGNALKYQTSENKPVIYDLNSYSVSRDYTGDIYEIIHKDTRVFSTLPEIYQDHYLKNQPLEERHLDKQIDIYTYYRRKQDNFESIRSVGKHTYLPSFKRYTKTDLPCIPLTWTTPYNSSYGVGLVQDSEIIFDDLNITNRSLKHLTRLMSKITVLISPESVLTKDAYTTSKHGDVLIGNPEEIGVLGMDTFNQIQALTDIRKQIEQKLNMIFLFHIGLRRDAERVTAEEIRYFASELQKGFSEFYSVVSKVWLKKEAEYLIQQNTPIGFDLLEIEITTGIESLSREGQVMNVMKSFEALAALAAVPPEIMQHINLKKYLEFIFRNNYVPHEEFMYTEQELQMQQQMQQEQLDQQREHEMMQQGMQQGMQPPPEGGQQVG